MEKTRAAKTHIFTIVTTALLIFQTGTVQSAKGQSSKLAAVPFTDVVIADKFWAPRMETNRKVTIPYAFKKCEETGRIDNFARAAGLMEGKFEGKYFNDSDVYKVIEGAAYSLRSHPDPQLEQYVDGVIDKIAAAQWEDGYLYAFYSLPERQPEKRWTNTRTMHELYCAGHFFEAAVAYYQATGKRKILDVAIRLADYIDSVFGPDKKRDVPGHEEIEIGLAKLYRVTGNENYLKLAKFFLDERGQAHGRELYGEYCQDHKPVTEQREAVGHAVRAGYLYCGMADVALLTGDTDYVRALDGIWQDVVSGKLYLTGGIGARGKGEAFGDNYELPNETAYCETCAAIANALWNHRMFLLHGDAKYVDVLERVIYNGFLSGISLEGEKFFYRNPLASDGKKQRSPWFGCACCPTNIVRFIPSIGQYAYAGSGDILYVNLFIAGSGTFKLENNTVKLRQQTRYPWDGDIKITVEPEKSADFTVYIRIPGWARNQPVPSDLYRYMSKSDEKVTLEVNGGSVALDMDKGFARIRRKWKKGDVVRLNLPMPVRRVLCNEKVKANDGKVALQCGPIVYCAEEADNAKNVSRVLLSADVELKAEYRKDLLGGLCVITGWIRSWHREQAHVYPDKQDFVAIPYYAWAHRGAGEMAVWLRRYLGLPEANVK
ncbi:MAG: glycoside hydrolase family 127 protein [Planctomycetota bacterium]